MTSAVPSPLSSPTQTPPNHSYRVLSAYYKQVTPLCDVLPINASEDVQDAGLAAMLRQTVVGNTAESGVGRLNSESFSCQDLSMREVLAQVHTRLFAQHERAQRKLKKINAKAFTTATPQNVLAFGYRPTRDWANDSIHETGLGANSIRNFHVNTIVTHLSTSKHWNQLLKKIGPYPILTLLSDPNIAIFSPLPNACYLQLSGTPISELVPMTKQFPAESAQSNSKNRTSAESQSSTRKRKRKRKSREESAVETDAETVATRPSSPTQSVADSPLCAPSAISPSKFARLLGPARSAPQLGGVPTQRDNMTSQSTLTLRSPLRVTQSTSAFTQPAKRGATTELKKTAKRRKLATLNKPNDVIFARHRIYHARPLKLKSGKLIYGLSSKNALSRLPKLFLIDSGDDTTKIRGLEAQARHLAKYIFPRQFGLHNPFTQPKVVSSIDLLPDYEDRELEIKKLGCIKTPARLKPVLPLLQRLIQLHSKCLYRKLLDRHCPTKTNKRTNSPSQADSADLLEIPGSLGGAFTQISAGNVSIEASHPSWVQAHGAQLAREKVETKPKFSDFMCESYRVELFVKAVLRDVIPRDFWGSPANEKLVLKYIVQFLRLRRYEPISVHSLLQGFCLADCDWLRPRSAEFPRNFQQKPNALEMKVRFELLQEFLFWLIDGFVIPLIRTNFTATDSATHANKTLFFRQDDWKFKTEPLLKILTETIFERIPQHELTRTMRFRALGYSYVRLLPKSTGVRPIVNLARRPIVIGPSGKKELGTTINKVLQSAFDVLTFEKKRNPQLVGALVASPQEIYEKLKNFKTKLILGGKPLPKLYFVKVDVIACYDTIKQEKLISIVDKILTESMYAIQRYSQVVQASAAPARKFVRRACAEEELDSFINLAHDLARDGLHSAVLADQVVSLTAHRHEIFNLLREHVTKNLVKIGGDLFRQRDGIPQGSVLSSLLCSLFYGHMEKTVLGFTQNSDSILLRYVDDFLFITTEKPLASQFLRVMAAGNSEYGCYVSNDKRLTNFDVQAQPGELIPYLAPGKDFPWCGLSINTTDLSVKANTAIYTQTEVANKLTVQRHRTPGASFLAALMRAVKIRSHVIYNDTNFNSLPGVYLNIYQSQLVVAMKFVGYIKEWKVNPQTRPEFFVSAIANLIEFEISVVKNRTRTKAAKELGAECQVKREAVHWLSLHAFQRVLHQKRSIYTKILSWITQEMETVQPRIRGQGLHELVTQEENNFVDKKTCA